MGKAVLTVHAIRGAFARARDLKKDQWISDGAQPRNAGGLQLRCTPSSAGTWYFRYSAPDGRKVRVTLGSHTEERKAGYLTLAEARVAVLAKTAVYRQPETRDVRAHEAAMRKRIAAERRAAEEAELAREAAARQAAADAADHTLTKLLATYIDTLRARGKSSAADAENIFLNHVTKAHPAIAAKTARDVEPLEVAAMLRTLTDAGKGRTAGKLRSYLGASFALALRAELDPGVPGTFIPFKVTGNPVVNTATLTEFRRARHRNLSEVELREYWLAVQAMEDGPIRDALLLVVLLGGQRPAQLLRAKVSDVDVAGANPTILLYDRKGKRRDPREHLLPLTSPAMAVVDRCLTRATKQKSQWLFSTFGKQQLRIETITIACSEIAAGLIARPEDDRVVKELFQLRDLRRTCSTRLGALGESADTRKHLQSHGLGGVQIIHYDMWKYMPQKKAALEKWADFLERLDGTNVVSLPQQAAGFG